MTKSSYDVFHKALNEELSVEEMSNIRRYLSTGASELAEPYLMALGVSSSLPEDRLIANSYINRSYSSDIVSAALKCCAIYMSNEEEYIEICNEFIRPSGPNDWDRDEEVCRTCLRVHASFLQKSGRKADDSILQKVAKNSDFHEITRGFAGDLIKYVNEGKWPTS